MRRTFGAPLGGTTRGAHQESLLNELVEPIALKLRLGTDGANVLGYMYWSLIDNWELQENYRHQSQFGLFHIERDGDGNAITDSNGNPPLHRAITEGALAYQQVIEESRALDTDGKPLAQALDNAQETFGALSADGTQIVPPSRTHGRFWEDEGKVTLYLGYTKADDKLIGMIYRHDAGTWHRADLAFDAQGLLLRESFFDDSGAAQSRDIRASYDNGTFTLTGGRAVPGLGVTLGCVMETA